METATSWSPAGRSHAKAEKATIWGRMLVVAWWALGWGSRTASSMRTENTAETRPSPSPSLPMISPL